MEARIVLEQIQSKIDEELEEIKLTLNDPMNDDEFSITDASRPSGRSTKQ